MTQLEADDAALADGDTSPRAGEKKRRWFRRRQASGSAQKRGKALPPYLRRRMRRSIPFLFLAILLGALVAAVLFERIVIFIRSGEAGVIYLLFEGGTRTDVIYPEGIHLIFPWNTMYIYNTRIQTKLHEFEVLTSKGLPISLQLAIRYHPEYEMVGLLHKHVGPDYVNSIVVPQIESVMRRNIGQQNPEDIYTNKEGILTSIVLVAIEETGQKFVFIEDIIIRAVLLPPDVRDAIEEKLVHQQKFQAYEFRLESERQEAKRRVIEAEGIRDYQRTVSETLDSELIRWQGVQATLELAKSHNAKVVVIGAGENGLPIILGNEAVPALPPTVESQQMPIDEPDSGATQPLTQASPSVKGSEPAEVSTAHVGVAETAPGPQMLFSGSGPASSVRFTDVPGR